MKELLKILILEDDTDDAEEIMRRLLLNEKFNCEFRLTIDKDAYLLALDEFYPSIILSDYSLPQFNSKEAFIIARQRFPGIPFIMVTGTISEEFAVDMIKMGVDDYILKDRMTRLPAAIITSVQRSKSEKEKQKAEEKIIQSETNLRAIFENTSEGFLLLDKDAVVMAFNKKAMAYTFFSKLKEFQIGQPIYDFIEESRKNFLQEIIAKVLNGESIQYDRSYEIQNGATLWIDFSATPVFESGQVKGICITGRDITEKKLMEQEILNQHVQEQKKITRAIIKAQEKERNHIGQELHDNVNQILASTKMYLSMAGKDNVKVSELVRYPMELIDSSIKEIRLLSSKQVTPLKKINLKELIQSLLEDLTKNTTIQPNFVYNVINEAIDDDLKLNIYRIIQEQINNIMKHAAPKNVNVSIQPNGKAIHIMETDDGKGFNTDNKTRRIGISNTINTIKSYTVTVAI